MILLLPTGEKRGEGPAARDERLGTAEVESGEWRVESSRAVGVAVELAHQPRELPHQLGSLVSRPPSPTPSFVERFAFPELPDLRERSPAPDSPKVVWPECNDTETARACAETADGILHQLSLERPTVAAFTSPGDGDGKTSLLIALAPQLAKRIAGGMLVVDANFCKPDLTARLNMPPGETPARPALIYPTNLPRLNVLPALRCRGGSTTATPTHSCTATPIKPAGPWIEELREGWSLVLLDTASLAHSEVTPLARCCDGVYLVVRLGHTTRRAVAEAFVRISPELEARIRANTLAKGNLLEVARLAGIQAAKRTAELIPLCHPLALDHVDVRAEVLPGRVAIRAEAAVTGKTGVEMEALTAAAVAALTVIDMGKSVDRSAVIEGLRVVQKSGGRSGDYLAPDAAR